MKQEFAAWLFQEFLTSILLRRFSVSHNFPIPPFRTKVINAVAANLPIVSLDFFRAFGRLIQTPEPMPRPIEEDFLPLEFAGRKVETRQ